jgi:hypothetical protein
MITTHYKTSDGSIFRTMEEAEYYERIMYDNEFDFITDKLNDSIVDIDKDHYATIDWLNKNRHNIERFFILHDILQKGNS